MKLAKRPDLLHALTLMENAALAYIPQEYPGRVTLFVSSEQFKQSYEESDLGWGAVAGGGLELCLVPGNHQSIWDEPLISNLAKELKARYEVNARPPLIPLR
jgi:thioesterase domain-containing protein